MTSRPGREIPKEYRIVAQHQVDTFGWRYDASGKGHPRLYPADITKSPITIAGTPGDQRGLRNFIAQVRRAGGEWPPGRRHQ
ncbi:hypothetical protein [Phytoactinopolyspora limicola]|uniref:hypothetical protein n=1 Tax=Phytoactinopolyspora limicola TaxID=2715536 RepID=UPI00140B1646|nr:hypothetical protein [Phytoactinopolyspora limicola]